MSFALKDEPLENLRPLKIRVIGAGFSGIYLGIRIPQRLRKVDLQIYEKNEGLGGTWWENRYPGCACDVPSHSYQYSFDPNPNWSSLYASAKEIQAYLQSIADKYGAMRYIKLSHKVNRCIWDDDLKKWKIQVKNTKTGDILEDDADILITARGNFNDIAWPDIPGLDKFQGEIMHSAAWNQDHDFKNKRVGVIGGGSSSIQLVPKIRQIEGVKMSCFIRSKTWISNPFGDSTMMKLGLDPERVDIPPEQRAEFASNPEKFYAFRKAIELGGNAAHAASIKGSEMQLRGAEFFRATMEKRLEKRPELFEFLIPSFAPGCRRLTPGPGYLEALIADNVEVITDKIKSINEKGVALESGRAVEIDTLVCATGFNVAVAPPFAVVGKNGKTLEDRWNPYAETYLSIGVDGFPNFFMMFGPNSAIGSGSLTMILESEGDYIVKCIRKLQKEDYLSMTPKSERVADFSQYIDAYFKTTVYMDECRSWYRRGDKITGLWPGSTLHALETLRAPRWEDFDFESKAENRLRWLGNGWSTTQINDGGDIAWYLEPSLMNVPLPERPEEDEEYKKRPFSH